MTRWLNHPLFAPVLVVAALGWSTLVIVFLLVGPSLGGWATAVLTYCFAWNATTRAYRLDTVLLATLQPPLFAVVVGVFYADDLRAFGRRLSGRLVGGAAVSGFLVAAATLLITGSVGDGARAAVPTPLREIRPAPRAVLTDHRGQPFELGRPLGRPVALTFVYTDCHASCPILIAKLRATEARVGERAVFAALTLAPEQDTPAVLAEYAARWELGAGFHLLTGVPAAVHALREAYGVEARRLADGEIVHDNVIVVLDGRGRVAFTLRGLGAEVEDLVALLARLATEG